MYYTYNSKDRLLTSQHSPIISLRFRSIGEAIDSIKFLVLYAYVTSSLEQSKSRNRKVTAIIMEESHCIFCSQIVTSRQEALLCGGCDRWQHRRCHTGVDRATYRQAVRTEQDISWTCLSFYVEITIESNFYSFTVKISIVNSFEKLIQYLNCICNLHLICKVLNK